MLLERRSMQGAIFLAFLYSLPLATEHFSPAWAEAHGAIASQQNAPQNAVYLMLPLIIFRLLPRRDTSPLTATSAHPRLKAAAVAILALAGGAAFFTIMIVAYRTGRTAELLFAFDIANLVSLLVMLIKLPPTDLVCTPVEPQPTTNANQAPAGAQASLV